MRELAPYAVFALLFAGCGATMTSSWFTGAMIGLFVGLGAARMGKGIVSRLRDVT